MVLLQIIWGVTASLICVVPGVGPAHATVLASILPGSELYCVVSSLLVSSFNEDTPTGNPIVDIFGGSAIAKEYTLQARVIGWFTGLVVAFVLHYPLGLIPSGGAFLTGLFALGLIFGCKKEKPTDWLALIGYLVGIGFIFQFAGLASVGYPAFLVGIVVFSVPRLIEGLPNRPSSREVTEGRPGIGLLAIAGTVSLFIPGVSAPGITRLLGGDSKNSSIQAAVAVDSFIEAAALTLMCFGTIKGKALVSMVASNPGVIELVACSTVIMFVAFMCRQVHIETATEQMITIGLFLNLFCLIAMCGFVGTIVALPLGLLCHKVSKNIDVSLLALTFIAPVI